MTRKIPNDHHLVASESETTTVHLTIVWNQNVGKVISIPPRCFALAPCSPQARRRSGRSAPPPGRAPAASAPPTSHSRTSALARSPLSRNCALAAFATAEEAPYVMTGLARSVRVLFAKNWRLKQRESRLNKNRATTPGTWLFPPLITDVILPLVVLLFFIQKLCDLNQTIPPTGDAELFSSRQLANQAIWSLPSVPTTSSAVTVLTALPLLLTTQNLSLVTLDRPENRALLSYLDREFEGDETLGLVPLSSLTKILPLPAEGSTNAADDLLEGYPKSSGVRVYAAFDLRRAAPLAPYEARVFFLEDDNHGTNKLDASDQVLNYFTVDVKQKDSGDSDGRVVQFPGVLPLQMELNRFLRTGAKSFKQRATTSVPPQTACRLVDTMLYDVGLSWQDFPSTSQLGGGEASCEKAIKAGTVRDKTLQFLSRLITTDSSLDTTRNLNVNSLPRRPKKIVAGSADSSIVVYTAFLFLWPYSRLVQDVVVEKEKQLKEYLLIMGLQPMALLASWFLLYLIASAAVVIVAVIMLSGSMFTATHSGEFHFAVLLMAFAISLLLFGTAITAMFGTARTAATVAPLLYMILGAAPLLQSYMGEDAVEHSLLRYVIWFMELVSSPTVFMQALRNITALDATTLTVRPIEWVTVAGPSIKMCFQSLGYLVLGWYLESVFPRAFGVQQPWYFVFQPSYWFPNRFGRSSSNADDDDELVQLTAGEESSTSEFPEDDTMREMSMADYMHHFRPILLVKALSKRFPNGKLAVNSVSFGVKKGEIFGLLGPNGAGKSTTMSILCGMLSPTGGDAFVGSRSVVDDPLSIRKSLSVCFQQNILFDELTVWEHLKLVYDLKTSLGIKAIDEEMWIHKLKHFGLEEKRDALSKTLSGGQKRKLSLVLALMDTSRVVLLDEPTAGMDLKARVDTWDALRKAVNHRAVILTTHSMQEAQALCENIGIVAEGKLKCCGSSLFLREKFGVGYKLTVVHRDDALDRDEDSSSGRTKSILSIVKDHLPSAVLVSENKWETRVQLNSDEPASLIPVFKELEQLKQGDKIKRYAVAATDLEDVFVKVTEGGDIYYHVKDGEHPELSSKVERHVDYPSSSQSDAAQYSDIQAIPLQLRTLVLKRWKLMIRDKRAFIAQYVWPLAFYMFFLSIITNIPAGNNFLETVTTLPATASHTSLFVGTLPDATSTAQHIYEHLDADVRTRVKWQEVATPAQIIDKIIHNDTSTSYFGAVLIRNVTAEGSPLLQFSVYYNDTIKRSLPVALEWISVAYCKSIADKTGVKPADCDLSFTKSAFPRKSIISVNIGGGDTKAVGVGSQADGDNMAMRFITAIYILFTLSSITASYITAVVKEREGGLKRLQYLHLASERASTVYWFSHLVYDYIGYMLAIAAVILITVSYHTGWTGELLAPLIVLTVALGLSILAFSYLASLAFSSHSSAQSVMSFVSTFQVIGSTVVFILSNIPSTCSQANTAAMFLRAMPLFAYGEALLFLASPALGSLREQCVRTNEVMRSLVNTEGFPFEVGATSPWSWSSTGRPLTYMVTSFVVYMALLLVIDTMQSYPTILQNRLNWIMQRQTPTDTYRPVAHDIESPSRDIIEVEHLTKVYNPKKSATSSQSEAPATNEEDQPVLNQQGQVVAVDNVSFVVERNDCVALLGVNGSGKSTTFEVLTSGIAPTSGSARIDGIDVTLQPQLAGRQYGYCPQTNIQFAEMTVREHLQLCYRLRTRHQYMARVEEAALQSLMSKLDLHQVAHTAAGHLSGGNKRRLMLALSLLSDEVSLLLMDEPSAGVDVVARRLMWKVLYDKRQANRDVSCLFTTHSMEEAEAVCANAVVLNKGKLVWNGSIPELKHHAASGISITVRLDTASIWEAERVRYYVDKVRAVLSRSPSGQLALQEGKIVSDELLNAWRVCRDNHPRTKNQAATNTEHQWISALIARVQQERSATASSDETPSIPASLDISAFVKEWLLREAFATIEAQLFQDKISSRSGELVKPVTLHDAPGSGSSTTAVYETNCNDRFALIDAFTTLESHKEAFSIARYSISELSLERVFEQFT